MGVKNFVLAAVSLALVLSVISIASAEIIISQPKALYSLGDELSLEIKTDSIKTGYMDVNMVCSGNTANLYHNVPDSKTVVIKRMLTPTYIENLSGSCAVVAAYSGETKQSQSFSVSEEVDVTLLSENLSVKAGESVKIKGTCYKDNNELLGQAYPAFVEARLVDSASNASVSKSDTVTDGQFEIELYVPESIHGGKKSVSIRVYDEDSSGDELNSGEMTATLDVIQEPAKITIAIDKLSLIPGENTTIIPFLYDKAGDSIEGKVKIIIYDSQNKSLYESTLDANKPIIYMTSTGNVPGANIVIAQKDAVTGEKSFEIKELRQVSANLSGNILTITNTGNVPYKGDIEVNISGKSVVEYVELEYGESKQFRIYAPDGDYEVSIVDSGSSPLLSQNGVSLTGSAIDMKQVRTTWDNILLAYPIVWIFVFVVLALFLWVYYRKYQSQKRVPKVFAEGSSSSAGKRGGIEVIKPESINEKIDDVVLQGGVRRAEQVLVIDGKRQPAGVIALKIRGNLEGIARAKLAEALEYAYRNKAVACISGDTTLLIFSPLITKTFSNDEITIKSAMDIDNFLKEHNRKFRNNLIDYGIGVNSGEILNKIDGKILKFANMGRTINMAKKVAELANSEVLLSKDIHEKTMSSIKTEKVASGAADLFSVKRVVNQEDNSKFIKDFLKRNQQ